MERVEIPKELYIDLLMMVSNILGEWNSRGDKPHMLFCEKHIHESVIKRYRYLLTQLNDCYYEPIRKD